MCLGGKPLLKANVEQSQFQLEYLDPWEELKSDDKFKELIKVAESKLQDAAKRVDKGKGKGPQ